MWSRKVFIRIIEVLLCIACVIALRVTDDESRRVFHYLRNRSLEWSLLNNVTWGVIGQAFATATCGGYVIVTTGLLIAAVTGELRGRKTECFFLGMGVIFFGIVGGLCLAAIDSVPQDLVDNAAVLGVLCLLTALTFIIDLLMSSHQIKSKNDGIQTHHNSKDLVKPVTTMTVEEETKIMRSNGGLKPTNNLRDSRGKFNDELKKSEGLQLHENLDNIDYIDRPVHDHDVNRDNQRRLSHRSSETLEEDRNRKFQNAERQTQSLQNLDRSQRYQRDFLDESLTNENRERRLRREVESPRLQDSYNRTIDELDTPRFPFNIERKEPIFAKIVNPGVKIVRVDRDIEETIENFRHPGTDNFNETPTRMFSNGFMRNGQDSVFSVPRPSRYRHHERTKDEVEVLEEYYSSYETTTATTTTTTGTQTGNRMPASPNDPGFVRHTANNWPRNTKKENGNLRI